MNFNVTDKYPGEVMKIVRKINKLTLSDFTNELNKSPFWEHSKENNQHRIYVGDFIKLAKIFNFDLCFSLKENERKLYLLDYDSASLVKYMREVTEKNQTEFAKSIDKGRDWLASIETGRNNYYIDDLFDLAKKHNFEIELLIKNKQ